MTVDDLMHAWQDCNVLAFLRMLREGESSQADDAYRMQFGGSLFDAPPWRHPNTVISRNGISSTAAGAYQHLYKTWAAQVRQYGFTDFSPPNQDLAAIALIAGRGALDLVKQGRIDEAIRLCGKEWASLPGSPYGQPTLTLERALAVYQQHGGSLAPAAQNRVVPTKEVKPVAPIILPLLEIAASLIPQLGKMFGSGSEVATRNVAAASIVADKLVEATASVNLQEAVEKLQNDPGALTAAKQAVSDVMFSLGEAGGGGIKAARDAAIASDGDWKKVRFSAPLIIALLMLPLIYAVVAAALLNVPWLAEMPNEVRAGVIGSVTGLILGSLVGFFYGTSASSQRKTELAAR